MGIRAGIIGIASFYSRAFAGALRRHRDVELVAAAHLGDTDANLTAAGALARADYAAQHQLTLYESPEEMIEKERLNAAFVCARDHRKADYVEIAAAAGLDVYLSKPMAGSIEEADRIAAAAQRHRILISTLSPARYDGAFAEAYRRVRNGEVGRVLAVRAWIQHGQLDVKRVNEVSPEFGPGQGGPELGLGVYAADALCWFMGDRPTRVYAEYDNLNTPGSPFMDVGAGTVRFAGGGIGSMVLYYSTPCSAPPWEVEIVGDKGILRTHQDVYEGILWRTGDPLVVPFYRNQNDVIGRGIDLFVEACLKRTEPEYRIDVARDVIEVCFAWNRSAATGAPVDLPLKREG